MSDKKEAKSGGDAQTQASVVALILILAVLKKVWPMIDDFLRGHRTTILLSLSCLLVCALAYLIAKAWNWYARRSQENGITKKDDTSAFLGVEKDSGRLVHLKQPFRTMHAQVIGTTNAGKSESFILPCAIKDIENGSGVLIIDGKSDAKFVNKLYAYVKHFGRENDFRLFSLANPGASSSFNPLSGNSPQEVTERVFSSFTFENEFYKNIQFKMFLSIVRLIFSMKETPTLSLVQRLLIDSEELGRWVAACPDELLKRDLARFLKQPEKDREEKVSGLETMLSHFTAGEIGDLFEETDHSINFDTAMAENQIKCLSG